MAVKGFQLVKTLIIAYVITAVLLLLTAFGLYRLHLSDWQVMAAVVIIYALSCFAGGYILAKAQKSRRMLWGMGFGILYFTVLTAAAFILTKGARYGYDSTCKGTDCLPFGRWSRSICNA